MRGMKQHKVKIFEYILHGASVKFCRLCFSTVSEGDRAYHSEDKVYIKSEYFSDTLLLKRILESLLSSKIDSKVTSQLICVNCADELIKCFIFSKKCQKIEHFWIQSLNLLEKNVKHNYNQLKNNTIADKIYIKLKKVKKKVRNKAKSEKHEAASNKTEQYFSDSKSNCSDDISNNKKSTTTLGSKNKTCDSCKRTFRHRCSYLRHVKLYCGMKKPEKYDGNFVTCFVCNGYYKHRDSLLKHLKGVCLKDNPVALKNYLVERNINAGLGFMCQYCGKRLTTRKGYREHTAACSVKTTNICQSEQFICDMCDAVFYVKRSMVNHWLNKHVEKSVPCHVCGKLFKTKNKIHAHMIVHTRERNHKCDMCNRYFVTKHALIYHTRLHTGEKPYPCSLCDEKFLSASRRMDHMRKKHWEPTFKCRLCHRFCTTKYSLKVHEMRHYKPNAQLKKVIYQKNV